MSFLRPNPHSSRRHAAGFVLLLALAAASGASRGQEPAPAPAPAPAATPAQTSAPAAGADPADPRAMAQADRVKVPLFPKTETELREQEPVAISFALGEIDGVDKALTEGVTAQGWTRKVTVERTPIGQVIVTTVALEEREEEIGGEGLAAQFEAKQSKLFPAQQDLTVEGSRTALVAALQRLREKKEEVKAQGEPKQAASGRDGASGSAQKAASNASRNSDAAGYRNPSAPTATPPEETPPAAPAETEARSTTEGCAVRVDIPQMRAIQQSRVELYVGGKLESAEDCADSEVSYPLVRSFAGCPDKVDVGALTAWPQYTLVYSDGGGTTHTVADCAPDQDAPYAIQEVAGSCGIRVDQRSGQAVQQVALAYTDRAGREVQVRGCQDSDTSHALAAERGSCPDKVDIGRMTAWPQVRSTYTAPDGTTQTVGDCKPDDGAAYPITETTAGCEIRVDLAGGRAIAQAALAYTDGTGREVQVRGCEDSQTSYPLTTSPGTCPDKVEVDVLTAWQQVALGYTDAAGTVHTVGECAPNPEVSYQIEEDPASCPIATDVAAGVVVQQVALHYTDAAGAQVQVRGCGPSVDAYVLERSYSACPDKVDLAAMTAWPQFNLGYTDDQGARKVVIDCRPDDERAIALEQSSLSCPDQVDIAQLKARPQAAIVYTGGDGTTRTVAECAPVAQTVYPITETAAGCLPTTDFAQARLVMQTALAYTDATGRQVEVRGCDASVTQASVAMTKTTATCPLRHDYTAGRSYELATWTYKQGGQTYEAAPCADTGRSFAHKTVTKDAANNNICPPIVNEADGTITYQSRQAITIDGRTEYVSDCAPASSANLAAENCDISQWKHDFRAGVSYAARRYYYMSAGVRQYVSSCLPDGASYTHAQTVVGWQNDDGGRFGYPLTTVTIRVGAATHTLGTAMLLPGTAKMAYVVQGTDDRPNGEYVTSGCTARQKTTRWRTWERPDGSLYSQEIGAGANLPPADVCTSTTATATYYQVSTRRYGGGHNWSGQAAQVRLEREIQRNPISGDEFVGNKRITGSSLADMATVNAVVAEGSVQTCDSSVLSGSFFGVSSSCDLTSHVGPNSASSGPCQGTQVVTKVNNGTRFEASCGYSPAAARTWP